jgi:hypothetical protein
MVERFWSRVDKAGPVPKVRSDLGPCWMWTGAKRSGKYGHLLDDHGKSVAAYRFAYELANGPIAAGLHLDHLCMNPPCVNPSHLEPVTQRVNNQRAGGIAGVNMRKTHCPFGHEFTKANTYIRPNGSRMCRTCHRRREKIRQSKREEAVA